jgi:O-succinylbenzoic acid--CoA ligase
VVGIISDAQIVEYLENELGSFAKPKGIHHMNSLPLLGIGKVDRMSLAKGIGHE